MVTCDEAVRLHQTDIKILLYNEVVNNLIYRNIHDHNSILHALLVPDILV